MTTLGRLMACVAGLLLVTGGVAHAKSFPKATTWKQQSKGKVAQLRPFKHKKNPGPGEGRTYHLDRPVREGLKHSLYMR